MRVDGLMIIDRKGVGPSLALIYSSCTQRALQLLVLAAWTICSVNPGKGIRRRLRLVGSIGSIGSIGSFCGVDPMLKTMPAMKKSKIRCR